MYFNMCHNGNEATSGENLLCIHSYCELELALNGTLCHEEIFPSSSDYKYIQKQQLPVFGGIYVQRL